MSDASDIGGALERLVNQFADPLSFFRELIQNAVDAGSREVEIWFEFLPSEKDAKQGAMVIHVDDFGEGMDRTIIDTQLTRLFSSAKDGDLTKIGKFGIGFVSVFAIKPDAVCVDTSRAGENWRVLFDADRSFTRIERDEPTEGTKIQLIKSVSEQEFLELRSRAKSTVEFWCKYIKAEIRFDDQSINRPFELDLPLTVRYKDELCEIVCGYAQETPRLGFYNRGLTLLEGEETGYPGIAYIIDSRYLEHTLARDNVVKDANYRKAMALVARLATEELPSKLFAEIETALRRDDAPRLEQLWTLAISQLAALRKLPSDQRSKAFVRTLGGRELDFNTVLDEAADRTIWIAGERSALTDAVEADHGPVVCRTKALSRLLRGLLSQETSLANHKFCMPRKLDTPAEEKWLTLVGAVHNLLEAHEAKVSEVLLASLDYPESGIADRVAVAQLEPFSLSSREDAVTLGHSIFSRKRTLLINVDHKTVQLLATLALQEPELAAYTLTKLFFLGNQLDPELDGRLGTLSVEMRCRRLNG